MTVMLPLQMAHSMIGEVFHEWLGIAMLIMFALHHVLNFRFLAALPKGKYTPHRIFLSVIDLLLLADMLALMVSAVMISHHVFAFLPIAGGTELARLVHLSGTHWGFALMSMHIGLHFHMATGMVQKKLPKSSRISKLLSRAICAVVAVYGLYAFLGRQLLDYMLLKTQFVFFDFSEPITHFMLDYISMMVLFGAIGYYIGKVLRRKKIS